MQGRTYDTIVVGAGSAGAAIAGRLTEDDGRQVLLLEAGLDYRSADTPVEMQSIYPMGVMGTEAIVAAYTFPQLMATRASGQEPRHYPRGRGVGGSSAINGMFAIRATVEDFDGWAAQGCEGWGYDNILPLLNRLENDQDFGNEPYHGDSGPIPVVRPRRDDFTPVEDAVDELAQRLGFPWAPDHNAPGSTGVSPYAYNGAGPRRVSTNDAYIEPARERPGLHVIGNALVDRVLFDGGRAVGVRAIVDGQPMDLHAKEVVVSGGAIHSPAILLRSGIGPAAELRQHGIEVVADLPVGRGLQDHAGIVLGLVLEEPLATTPARQGNVCVRFDTGVGGEVNDAMIAAVTALGIGVPVAGLIGFVNRVNSTGTVRLAATDPTVDPVVDMNLLSHPDDMQRMRAVVEQLQTFAAQPVLQKVAPTILLGGTMPADAVMSDSEFTAFAMEHVTDTVHASGTCRMGAAGDPEVVVDPVGRVYGVDGLRVADASLFPWVPRANTNLTAILVGEKVADSIRSTS